MKCLEIGPGDGPARPASGEEWSTMTADRRKKATYHARWGYQRLPLPDDSFDLVYASHVIEHIPWYKTVEALQEARRIIRPGGTIELWTVDFQQVVESYVHNDIPDDWRRYNPAGKLMMWINGRIFAYDKCDGDELNMHRACFDLRHLHDCCIAAGFSATFGLAQPRGEDHGKINLGLGARK